MIEIHDSHQDYSATVAGRKACVQAGVRVAIFLLNNVQYIKEMSIGFNVDHPNSHERACLSTHPLARLSRQIWTTFRWHIEVGSLSPPRKPNGNQPHSTYHKLREACN